MVKILSNGDIVPDDDPRATRSASKRNEGGNTQPRQGFIRHEDHANEEMVGQVSIFDSLNQRLLDAGVPRWNAGPYLIEPIVSLGFLLAGLLLGLKGLLFGAILFFVVKYSQGARGPAPYGGNNRGARPAGGGGGGGGGYTLGRS
ncbi:protein FAM241B-like [Gigantopelta aegis]|uniref:protein FAM241B-like n=1 Tax=Gigantopelta aegis TaxID=1735272 RepID=UPI001B88B51F|nr:protein FAM241B-like [Gigantopelta aegis]